MADTRNPFDEQPCWCPDPDQVELFANAWDAIETILDELVQETACTNKAIRGLLGGHAADWSDPHEELAEEVRIRRHLQKEGR